jgi:hypothetical protein
MKAEWSDGTAHLFFEPIELLERLAALTPHPRINLVLHHRVQAPHSRWRARAVAYGRDTHASPAPDPVIACGTSHLPVSRGSQGLPASRSELTIAFAPSPAHLLAAVERLSSL